MSILKRVALAAAGLALFGCHPALADLCMVGSPKEMVPKYLASAHETPLLEMDVFMGDRGEKLPGVLAVAPDGKWVMILIYSDRACFVGGGDGARPARTDAPVRVPAPAKPGADL